MELFLRKRAQLYYELNKEDNPWHVRQNIHWYNALTLWMEKNPQRLKLCMYVFMYVCTCTCVLVRRKKGSSPPPPPPIDDYHYCAWGCDSEHAACCFSVYLVGLYLDSILGCCDLKTWQWSSDKAAGSMWTHTIPLHQGNTLAYQCHACSCATTLPIIGVHSDTDFWKQHCYMQSPGDYNTRHPALDLTLIERRASFPTVFKAIHSQYFVAELKACSILVKLYTFELYISTWYIYATIHDQV